MPFDFWGQAINFRPNNCFNDEGDLWRRSIRNEIDSELLFALEKKQVQSELWRLYENLSYDKVITDKG